MNQLISYVISFDRIAFTYDQFLVSLHTNAAAADSNMSAERSQDNRKKRKLSNDVENTTQIRYEQEENYINSGLLNQSIAHDELDILNRTSDQSVNNVARNESKDKMRFKCDVCGYMTWKKSSMVQHTRTHTGEKPFQCDFCSYKASDKSALIVHTRTHTGEKPFQCEICSFLTTQKSALTVHKRIHTNVKPFHCDFCNYKTSYKSCLTNHKRMHTAKHPM